ncbi:MAG: hypothetical protein HRU32_16480, partial [Rhodobacteraceae bacterium]|nr:hypothetical protein [Paracoccaceae bacterium]
MSIKTLLSLIEASKIVISHYNELIDCKTNDSTPLYGVLTYLIFIYQGEKDIIDMASKFLISIGACATSGGIQALRNFADVKEFTKV